MDFDYRILIRHIPDLARGFEWTILLCAGAIAVGVPLGIAACVGKLMRTGPFYWMSVAFVDAFRTLPEMVTLFWIYYCVPLVFGLKMSPAVSGLVALSVYAGAFLAEIFRSGLLAVPRGQIEAAYAIGLPRFWIWWSVIVPQALRVMTPPLVSFLTSLIKVSGLLSTIGVAEMTYEATILSGRTYKYLEFFTAIGIVYFAMIFPLSMAAQSLERRVARRQR